MDLIEISNLLKSIRLYSNCKKKKVSAVLYCRDSNRAIGLGVNKNPVSNICNEHTCLINNICVNTVHAEISALKDTVIKDNSLNNFIVISSHEPCYYCVKILVNFGCKEFLFLESSTGKSGFGSGKEFCNKFKIPFQQLNMKGII